MVHNTNTRPREIGCPWFESALVHRERVARLRGERLVARWGIIAPMKLPTWALGTGCFGGRQWDRGTAGGAQAQWGRGAAEEVTREMRWRDLATARA